MTTESEFPAPGGGGFRIFGQVRGAGGKPIPGVVLTMIDPGGHQLDRGRTGEDGSYELTTPRRGTVVLIASARAYQPHAATVAVLDGPVRVDIELRGASSLSGTVHGAGGGVPGAALTLIEPDGEVVDARTTGVAGEYAFGTLPAGEYTLTVNAESYQPTARTVSIGSDEDTRLDVELIRGAAIAGTIRTPDGKLPLPAAQVAVLDAAGSVIATATAGTAGDYTIDGLGAGSYTVIATSYPPTTQALRLEDGQHTRHDIRLG